MSGVVFQFKGYTVQHWTPHDREGAAGVVRACLEEYGLQFEPKGADRDSVEVEDCYVRGEKGEFWVVMDAQSKLVGTAGYYEVSSADKAVEIRKMYLLPEARGKKLGRALLEVSCECIITPVFQMMHALEPSRSIIHGIQKPI